LAFHILIVISDHHHQCHHHPILDHHYYLSNFFSTTRYDIILTTPNILANKEERRIFFSFIKFSYMVVDEAHFLKTASTMRAQGMHKVKADKRILLTGTPVQNSLGELCELNFRSSDSKYIFTTVQNSLGELCALKKSANDIE
jgi:hypothetical protein